MTSDPTRLCDASPLTDGELHILAERHPALEGHAAAVVLGARDERVVEALEALFAAFSDTNDRRFGLATLSGGERVLLSERRPEFSDHAFDLIAATSDAAIARVVDSFVALFGDAKAAHAVAPVAAPAKESAKARKEAAKELPAAPPVLAVEPAEPVVAEEHAAAPVADADDDILIGDEDHAPRPVSVTTANNEPAPWAQRLGS